MPPRRSQDAPRRLQDIYKPPPRRVQGRWINPVRINPPPANHQDASKTASRCLQAVPKTLQDGSKTPASHPQNLVLGGARPHEGGPSQTRRHDLPKTMSDIFPKRGLMGETSKEFGRMTSSLGLTKEENGDIFGTRLFRPLGRRNPAVGGKDRR